MNELTSRQRVVRWKYTHVSKERTTMVKIYPNAWFCIT